MLLKNHNDASKQLIQKILMYIDSVLVNAAGSDPNDVIKTLTSGIINVRDALFSEIVQDNHIEKINNSIMQKENKKKPKEEDQETE